MPSGHHSNVLFFSVGILCGFAIKRCSTIWVTGAKTVPKNKAIFIAKFCFDYDSNGNHTGEVDFRIKSVSPGHGALRVALLDDQEDSYPDGSSRWPGYACDDDRLEVAAKRQWKIDPETMTTKNNRLKTYIVERLRPRWWFVALIDCSGIDHEIEYSLHMVNNNLGWMQELSLDHCGVISLAIVAIGYFGLAIAQIKALFMQSTARTKHPLRLCLAMGIGAALWSTGLYFLDTVWYAFHGQEAYPMYVASKFLEAFSKFTLMFILMLLSRGRCISSDLHLKDIWNTTFIIAPFLAFCFFLKLGGEYDQSRKYTTDFVYNTWIGGVLVLLDLVLLALYSYNLFFTYSEESDPDKKVFYRTWGLVYSATFLKLPVSVVTAFFVSPWVRSSTMFIFSNTIHMSLLCLLVAGLWPEKTQAAFCIDKKLAFTYGLQSDNLLTSEEVMDGSNGASCFDIDDSARQPNLHAAA